jgi:hypothetical protein
VKTILSIAVLISVFAVCLQFASLLAIDQAICIADAAPDAPEKS